MIAGTLGGFFTQLVVPGAALGGFLLAGFPLGFLLGGGGSLLLRGQRFGIGGYGSRHIVSGRGIQHHVDHLLHILAGRLVQHHHGHLLYLGLNLNRGHSLLYGLNNRLGCLNCSLRNLLHGLHHRLNDGLSCLYDSFWRLLHGLDHRLSRLNHGLGNLLHGLNNRLGCLRNGFRRLLYGLNHGLGRLYDGFGNLLYSFNDGRRRLLYGLGRILDRGHGLDFFLDILTGGRIKNLEFLSHFSCAVLSSCAARGVVK